MKEPSEAGSVSSRGPNAPGGIGNSSSSEASSKSPKQGALSDLGEIVQSLIAAELRANDSSDTVGRAAFRICGKLRQPLSSLIGVVGFRSLFSRALTLAKEEVPWLGAATITGDGIIEFSTEMDSRSGEKEAGRGGTMLLTQLLGLLIIFIGETLTLRLMRNVWPKAFADQTGPKGRKS